MTQVYRKLVCILLICLVKCVTVEGSVVCVNVNSVYVSVHVVFCAFICLITHRVSIREHEYLSL